MAMWGYDSPAFAEEIGRKGAARHEQGDLEAAIRDYDRALQLDSRIAWILGQRGWAKVQQGDTRSGLADFDQALRVDVSWTASHWHRAWARLDLGDHAGALADYAALAEIAPDDPRVYANRAAVHAAAGDFEKALDDCRFSIELAPGTSEPYLARSQLFVRRGAWDEALSDCARALGIEANAVGLHQRGFVLLARGDAASARPDFEQAERLSPHWGWNQYGLAASAYCLSDWDSASRSFERARDLSGGDRLLRDYSILRIWMSKARAGRRTGAAADWLSKLRDRVDRRRDEWLWGIADFVLGRIPEPDLFRLAASRIPGVARGRECQAHFHAGFRRLLEGATDAAAQAMEACLGTGRFEFYESALARADLQRLRR